MRYTYIQDLIVTLLLPNYVLAKSKLIGKLCKYYSRKLKMTEQTPPMVYNNSRFRVVDYNFDMFIGPAAGEQFKDFALTDLDSGKEVIMIDSPNPKNVCKYKIMLAKTIERGKINIVGVDPNIAEDLVEECIKQNQVNRKI